MISRVSAVIIQLYVSSDNILQDKPIDIAVSTLSPVKTHRFIPASFISAIVSAQSSCNLSLMPVHPIISISASISAQTFCQASSCFDSSALRAVRNLSS